METKQYILKGYRCNNRGSFSLLNDGATLYKQETGLLPSAIILSERRRDTLPDDITDVGILFIEGGKCVVSFATDLTLNEMRLS